MELKVAQKIAKEAIKRANDVLGTDYIEIKFEDGKRFANDRVCAIFDRYFYIVRFNNDWLRTASEEEIIVAAYHEVRHGYQQTQIEFEEKLVDAGLDVEPQDRVMKWKDEFEFYEEPTGDEENDVDFLLQDCEIDAVAFSVIMYKVFESGEVKVLEVIKDKVEERMKEILAKVSFFN